MGGDEEMRVEVAARQVVLDGDAVRAWALGALTACRAARERIDAVNVFPVPDADTGSNVTLTVAGGAEAVAADPGDDGPAALLAAFARGAARSARGNSGIILSQWLVGLAAGLAQEGPLAAGAAAALVTGLERAAGAARDAVPDPQEGTILTVAREVAAHARRGVAGVTGSPADVLAAATDAARADLARLSAGHDVLRAARVVDAGACALLVVLDALVHTLRTGGGALGEADLDLAWLPRATPDVVAGCAPAAGGAYEVMMLVRPTWPGADDLARALQEVGDAVAVVDAGGSRHAHVHCDDPAAAIALVPRTAREQVVVRRVEEPAPAARGLVVLTASPGLSAWFATCGAVTLVGDDPGSEQVARAAVDTCAGRAVVVAAGVGPTGGAPAGAPFDLLTAPGDGPAVVACLALVADPGVTPDAGRDALRRLRAATPTGPETVPAAVTALLPQVPGAQGVTLVHGPGVDPAAARAAADALAAAHPQLEVVVAGPAAGADWWVGVD
ncbi:DAK2 domain-containing protein [Cellulomonas dongxiuzhuiae]|uniref:DAK2 domain-containing protein n=1 Tax=Cellulomonas dongxiuzhuiae TaxID=2819979 RepID=A0ABX8GGI1_9CELL|nr:DAK2 domain-containing protein [Cellulomonas dongxiuzhuiae]MBO3093888.1 DAK2 domain-containing protein [Cellulomonas dongxiuzhuiae]QWC14975.1 DAK2 domain-containing protein [Cellulomonas dongxiuzhuiae]